MVINFHFDRTYRYGAFRSVLDGVSVAPESVLGVETPGPGPTEAPNGTDPADPTDPTGITNPPAPALNCPLPAALLGAVIVPVSVALLQLPLPMSVLLLVLF